MPETKAKPSRESKNIIDCYGVKWDTSILSLDPNVVLQLGEGKLTTPVRHQVLGG